MRSVVERYQTDPEFRALVDVLASQIYAARYTPTEIREAAIMASTIVEAHTIRPAIIPLRDFDDLRPRDRPTLLEAGRAHLAAGGKIDRPRNHDDGGEGLPNP